MKYLHKRITKTVNGWDDSHSYLEAISYVLNDSKVSPENDKELSSEDCIENDCAFMTFSVYEFVSEISDSEILTLKKFGILKD
jgi:hypothetical protein